ncbi:nuclear exosome regulator NRDE2 isoform X6 [Lepidochelys kempii]|uniref:nuclear exosome regulator NRDE2 isoform X6 n=1 Tax=Lepidochelys kempii TaxID=8472 RepID=UPI003C6F8937
MALFPAFAGAAEPGETPASGSEGSRRELDWLSNPSFSTEDALKLHQHTAKASDPAPKRSQFISRSPSRSELSGGSDTNEDLKKSTKKRKGKKKKHHHHKKRKKKTREESSNSESDLDSECMRDKPRGSDTNREREAATLNLEDITSNVATNRFVWLEDIQALTAETFRTDKKPDPANWEYKSLYRGDIARYKRKGDSCLGIDLKKQCITWESSMVEKKQSPKRPERYFTKNSVKLLTTDGIPVYSKSQTSFGSSTFIPVSQLDSDAPTTTTCVNPLGIYDPLTTLWLQGKGPPEHETLKQQASQETSGNVNSILMAKVEEYNRMVRENPRDVHTWMEFVSFQDEILRGPSPYAIKEGEQEIRRKSFKLILEKKLAILERAIESNPNDVDLKLAKLKLCTEFWEPSTLIKEWQKLVFLHPNNPLLWQKYLLFCQSQFSTFSVSKVHSLYGKCLSTLAAVQDGSMVSHPILPGTEEAMLGVFLQQCHFLRQAGHSEKAVSLFQALVDFTFFKPDSVKDLPTRGQVEFFEPFWDSGEPRFGEKGAKGWKSWMHQQEKGGWIIINKPDDDEEDGDEDQEIKDKTLPRWQIWLDIECSRETRHWLPWRPDKTKKQTEEDCEDPERQVGQCLQAKNKKKLKSQGKKSKKLAKNLLKASENRNNLSLWKLYAYLEWLLGNTEDARKVFDTALCLAGTEGMRNTQLCNLSLLYASLEVELLESLEETVMSRAVHILTKLAESGPYVPYPGHVLSVNILKARKAYEHALQDYLNESPVSNWDQVSSSNQLVSLVGCYALFQYLTVGIDAAVLICRHISEKLKGSASRKFEGIGENLGIHNFPTALEAVTLMHTNLLRYHMKVSIYPLNPLREALTEALKLYPSNQSLWRSYIQIQSKSHNASKARRFFDSVTRSAKSLEPWLFAIQAEEMRKKLVENVQRVDVGEIYSTIPETGLKNRIKTLFEHAIQSENGTHCPLLWRMYLNFLFSVGDKERSKGLFYKALQNCPWAKVLYMDAIEYFPDQLQETLDLMTEKELRVRVPIEELELLLED